MSTIVFEHSALLDCCRALEEGGVIAIPTETVYGLAADARNREALARVFSIKKRPEYNPLIVHVGSVDMAKSIALFDPVAEKLAHAFWPGPLSLVLPYRVGSGIDPMVFGGLSTVALRMPCGFSLELIRKIGYPLAAPSANFSGKISPTNAQMVQKDLGELVDLIVDGGKTRLGLESTIVKIDAGAVEVLRAGMVTREKIEEVLGFSVQMPRVKNIQAPGMMKAHYAPQKKMRLYAEEVFPGEALLAFGPQRIKNFFLACMVHNLSQEGNLEEAASHLFYYLYLLDHSQATRIVVEPIPLVGCGEALNDRLVRAAAEKEE